MTASTENALGLPTVMDLDSIDAIRDWLLPAIEAGDVLLDGTEVERVATNSVLMLASAAHTAEMHKHSMTITGTSAALGDAISRLGLDGLFSNLVKDG